MANLEVSYSTRRHADNNGNQADLWPIKICHKTILRLNFTWNSSLLQNMKCPSWTQVKRQKWSSDRSGQRTANAQMTQTVGGVLVSQPHFTQTFHCFSNIVNAYPKCGAFTLTRTITTDELSIPQYWYWHGIIKRKYKVFKSIDSLQSRRDFFVRALSSQKILPPS